MSNNNFYQKYIYTNKSSLSKELCNIIIEMFENGFITEYIINETEYTNIFKIIKTIRIPLDEINNLKKLILFE